MEEFQNKVRGLVIEKYAAIVKGPSGGCATSCCDGSAPLVHITNLGKALDYTEENLTLSPGEANLGLGCGNPLSRAGLKPGEIVLDLGNGAGFDAFLAAKQVGESGMVIGVDMTQEMVQKAGLYRLSGGRLSPGEVKGILYDLGFQEVTISAKEQSEKIIQRWNVGEGAEKVVFSAYIEAVKTK